MIDSAVNIPLLSIRGIDKSFPGVQALRKVNLDLRRGEVLALHWRDLDLEAERLTVRRTVEQTKCGLRFKEPKTRGSRRTITLPSITIEALARHKAQQAEERMQLGLGKSDLVFTRWDGEPVNPRNFTKEFSRCVRGVDPTRWAADPGGWDTILDPPGE